MPFKVQSSVFQMWSLNGTLLKDTCINCNSEYDSWPFLCARNAMAEREKKIPEFNIGNTDKSVMFCISF